MKFFEKWAEQNELLDLFRSEINEPSDRLATEVSTRLSQQEFVTQVDKITQYFDENASREVSIGAAIALSEALHALAECNNNSLTITDGDWDKYHADVYLIKALQFLQTHEYTTLDETLLMMDLLIHIGSGRVISRTTEDYFDTTDPTSVQSEYTKLFVEVAQNVYSLARQTHNTDRLPEHLQKDFLDEQKQLTDILIAIGKFLNEHSASIEQSKRDLNRTVSIDDFLTKYGIVIGDFLDKNGIAADEFFDENGNAVQIGKLLAAKHLIIPDLFDELDRPVQLDNLFKPKRIKIQDENGESIRTNELLQAERITTDNLFDENGKPVRLDELFEINILVFYEKFFDENGNPVRLDELLKPRHIPINEFFAETNFSIDKLFGTTDIDDFLATNGIEGFSDINGAAIRIDQLLRAKGFSVSDFLATNDLSIDEFFETFGIAIKIDKIVDKHGATQINELFSTTNSNSQTALSRLKEQFVELAQTRHLELIGPDSIRLLDGSTRVVHLRDITLTPKDIVVGKDSVLVLENPNDMAGAIITVEPGGRLVINSKEHLNAEGARIQVLGGRLRTIGRLNLANALIHLSGGGTFIADSFDCEGASLEIDQTSTMYADQLKFNVGCDLESPNPMKLHLERSDDPGRAFQICESPSYFAETQGNYTEIEMVVLRRGPIQRLFGRPPIIESSRLDTAVFTRTPTTPGVESDRDVQAAAINLQTAS